RSSPTRRPWTCPRRRSASSRSSTPTRAARSTPAISSPRCEPTVRRPLQHRLLPHRLLPCSPLPRCPHAVPLQRLPRRDAYPDQPAGLAQLTDQDVYFTRFYSTSIEPLSRIQRISGPLLHASWVNVPHVTQFDLADITELEQVRAGLKDRAQAAGVKLTPLAFILRACVKALQQFPRFNAS